MCVEREEHEKAERKWVIISGSEDGHGTSHPPIVWGKIWNKQRAQLKGIDSSRTHTVVTNMPSGKKGERSQVSRWRAKKESRGIIRITTRGTATPLTRGGQFRSTDDRG